MRVNTTVRALLPHRHISASPSDDRTVNVTPYQQAAFRCYVYGERRDHCVSSTAVGAALVCAYVLA